MKCPWGCGGDGNCSDDGTCPECKSGLHGETCTETCGHCADGFCNQDGTCPGACKVGWSGADCKTPCTPSGCETCNQDNEDVCTSCKADSTGAYAGEVRLFGLQCQHRLPEGYCSSLSTGPNGAGCVCDAGGAPGTFYENGPSGISPPGTAACIGE